MAVGVSKVWEGAVEHATAILVISIVVKRRSGAKVSTSATIIVSVIWIWALIHTDPSFIVSERYGIYRADRHTLPCRIIRIGSFRTKISACHRPIVSKRISWTSFNAKVCCRICVGVLGAIVRSHIDPPKANIMAYPRIIVPKSSSQAQWDAFICEVVPIESWVVWAFLHASLG